MNSYGWDKVTRRGFLAAGATAAGALMAAPNRAMGASKELSPSEKLNFGVVGVGGVGRRNIQSLSDHHIAALCDVDDRHAEKVYQAFPEAKKYKDYREMLAAEENLDGVIVATPDHTHAVIAAAAIRAGKAVFCQKPLTHDIYEARELARIAKEAGATTQMGIQGHAMEGTWNIRQWLRAGLIGEVREVEAWCTDSYYPWGHKAWSPKAGSVPEGEAPIPDGLDWDLWLGPIEHHPYQPCYHPMSWRAFWAFGSGWMADRGAHSLDPAVWALDLGLPTRIDANSTGMTKEMHPLSAIVRFEFPARQNMPPVTVTWYTGLRPPRPSGVPSDEHLGDSTGGILFKGSEGMLTCGTYGQEPRLVPKSRMDKSPLPEPAEPWPGLIIEEDWVEAIRSGKPACADFSYSAPLTEICMLGNIAKRVDGTIEWDAGAMKVTNNPEANQYVRTQYREGWSL